VQDCYAVLGIIHNLWRPVPGRIKDFIAMPRPNLYQSLHTSVITENGETFEIQIRTEEMHKMCEEGIAAHWKYKDGPVSAEDEQRLAWLRQVVEWQRDVSDPNEFLSTLKVDLYPEEVYTFTPKGKVLVLPRESTPIDFAYSIHTEVGHSCTGAKVNGRMVPLRHKLHSGDIVEVITQPGHKPSRDWLAVVKSSRARNKIKHWLNVHQRERAIEIGRKLIEKEARKYRISLKEIKEADLQRAATEYGLGRPDDLMAGIGYGKYSARQVLAKFAPAGAQPRALPAAYRAAFQALSAASLAATPTPSWSADRVTSSSIAPAVVTPFAARPSSATSPAARALPSTPSTVPTSPIFSMNPTAASTCSGPATKTASPFPIP
jgi:GTP pyrophosphokinase